MRKSKEADTKRIDRAFRRMATDSRYQALAALIEEEFRFADHEELLHEHSRDASKKSMFHKIR